MQTRRMSRGRTLQGALCLSLVAAAACSSGEDGTDAGADAGEVPRDGGSTAVDGGGTATLYERLGGEGGIRTVIGDFVGRVVGDPAINGYFLNGSVSGGRLVTCLVKQVGALTGGPERYPAEGEPADADGCRNMTDSHRGLGISTQDFADLAGHLVAALEAAGVAQADREIIVGAVAPLQAIIVEDAEGQATIYQRVGRKPAVQVVVNDFVGRVLADPAINGYFLNAAVDGGRLTTCLVRQVCGLTGGPCRYGEDQPELPEGQPACRGMTAAHLGMGISSNDYADLAAHLVAALEAAGVATADIEAIATALTQPSFVATIVEDPDNDRTVYQRVGRKPAIRVVVEDFVGRVLNDASINGFFAGAYADRLLTCLVRQVCSIDGPCVYGEGVEPELEIEGRIVPCRDMASSHQGLTNPAGGAGSPITIDDWAATVGHLVDALDESGAVTPGDRDAVLEALAPLCPFIVANGTGCPG